MVYVVGKLENDGILLSVSSVKELRKMTGESLGNSVLPGQVIETRDSNAIAPQVARCVRDDAYRNVLCMLDGFQATARDNTLSAHAIVCDIRKRIESEIESPSFL